MSEKYVTAKEFEDYKKDLEKRIKKEQKPKVTRAPNEYNLYMKEKITELKKSDPKMSNKEAFSKSAETWSKDKEKKKIIPDAKEEPKEKEKE